MVDFWIYDVGFMILFSVFVAWFISSRKKNLSREGIIFMYRTKFGIKAINYVSDKFKKLLHGLKYIIITVGVALMGIMIWMLGQTLSIYILHPEITKIIKAPPIAPLIPYFPKLFGMESFFPPFYFTYFIVALAIVAIVHEFSHGIFMRLFKIKIKSTGLVFLGPILGAFVEEEKKGFEKKKNLEQMTVLGAGVFANLIFALIFYVLYVLFFFSSFVASGYVFDTYALAVIPLDQVTSFGSYNNLTTVITANGTFYLDDDLVAKLNQTKGNFFLAYMETPAILARMKGAIIQADDVKILNQNSLIEFLQSKEPGDEVKFVTETDEGVNEYTLNLGHHPYNDDNAYLGIGHSNAEPKNFIQKILGKFMSFKDSSTYYKPTWDGEFVYFIYHLLWWVMIINLLVAIFNMMPLGMLDGGRFFYLAILSISRSEKFAKGAFKFANYAIGLIFLLLMFFWFINII